MKHKVRLTVIDKKLYPELQQHELAAFLLVCLSRYVLPGCPDHGIAPMLVPMAIKLSKGTKYPFGLLYLGSLYMRYQEVLPHDVLEGVAKILEGAVAASTKKVLLWKVL